MFEIRLLTAGDAEAFGESANEHRATTVESVPARVANGGTVSFVVGAFDGSGLAAVVGFYRDPREKRRHKGHIWGMYVAQRLRGQGAGEALLAEAIRVPKTGPGLRTILLSVSETQGAARRLYERMGFVEYGVEPFALRVGDRDLTEQFLMLTLY